MQPTGPGLRSVYAAEFSYTAGGDSSWDDNEYGEVETFRTRVSYSLSWTPSPDWNWRIGPGWDYFAFRATDQAPFPDELHGVGLRLGGSWRPARRWTVLAELRPGLYSDLVDVSGDDFNVPVMVGGGYQVTTNFLLVAGLGINFRSRLATMGGPGLWWRFAEHWTLNLILPRPALEFTPTPRLSFFVGGEWQGGGWRVSEKFGEERGRPELNNDVLGYRELRLGGGVRYRWGPALRLTLEAGHTVNRQFEYRDADEEVDVDNAAYVQFGIGGRF